VDLSIIFVNWNSTDYLRECLASIYQYTHGVLFEIIVVDNASPVGDVGVLAQLYPEITIIQSDKNLGFAGANNLGFRQSSGTFVLFLNPDTKLVGTAINSMLQHLNALPDAGAVGCKLLRADYSVDTNCIQRFPTILNQMLEIEALRRRWPNSRLWGIAPLFSDDKHPAQVEVVSGACMMLKRDVFQNVGGFSEDYFMYAEDVDLCYRLQKLGLANYYVGEASVVHYGGKSSAPQWAIRMKLKAILQFCEKTRGRLYALTYRMALAPVAMGRLLLIGILLARRSTLGERQALRAASAKWLIILKTLLTHQS
jgi:GT2 family glycosyltransferase